MAFGIALTRIGRVTAGQGVRPVGQGAIDVPDGFDHFRQDQGGGGALKG